MALSRIEFLAGAPVVVMAMLSTMKTLVSVVAGAGGLPDEREERDGGPGSLPARDASLRTSIETKL